MNGDKFIVKYSTKDIMDKLNDIHRDVGQLNVKVARTNGRVKLHTKLIWGAYGFIFSVFIFLLSMILR